MSNRDWCEEHGENYNELNSIRNYGDPPFHSREYWEEVEREERDAEARIYETMLEEISNK